MANKKEVKTDREIADSFEQDKYEIPNCIEYYGTPGFTVEDIAHPDNLWTLLDRLHSELMEEQGEFGRNITKEQRRWLQDWVSKWMDEIEPYCVRLESE